jgi:hypothetical protein
MGFQIKGEPRKAPATYQPELSLDLNLKKATPPFIHPSTHDKPDLSLRRKQIFLQGRYLIRTALPLDPLC